MDEKYKGNKPSEKNKKLAKAMQLALMNGLDLRNMTPEQIAEKVKDIHKTAEKAVDPDYEWPKDES